MSLSRLIRNAKRPAILTPRLDQYLATRPEMFPLSSITARWLAAQVMVQPRDRFGSFSSSSRGSCMRRQVFEYLGAPARPSTDVVLRQVFNDGHWRHLRWQTMLLEAGLLTHVEVPWDWQDEEGKVWLKGSMDGVNDVEKWGFELKGTRALSLHRDEPAWAHLLQIHTYMLGTGLRTFVLIYEDKSSQEWVEHVVTYDESIANAVVEELVALKEYIETQVLPPMLGDCQDRKGPFVSCPFRDYCPRQEGGTIKPAVGPRRRG